MQTVLESIWNRLIINCVINIHKKFFMYIRVCVRDLDI
jgi:hypothetical protein